MGAGEVWAKPGGWGRCTGELEGLGRVAARGEGLGVASCVRGEVQEFWGRAAGRGMEGLGVQSVAWGLCLEGAPGENVLAVGEGSREVCTEIRIVHWGFWGDLEGP